MQIIPIPARRLETGSPRDSPCPQHFQSDGCEDLPSPCLERVSGPHIEEKIKAIVYTPPTKLVAGAPVGTGIEERQREMDRGGASRKAELSETISKQVGERHLIVQTKGPKIVWEN